MDIKDENIIEITAELSSEFEVAKELRKYPKDTVIIKNVKRDMICQLFPNLQYKRKK